MKLFGNQFSLNAKSKFILALCTVAALSASPLRADDTDKQKSQGAPDRDSTTAAGGASRVDRSDEKFVKDAAKSGQMEVHMGKIGVQKSQNPQVKQFAQKLIDDHGKANAELKQIATSKGITLPPEASDKVASTTDDPTASDRTRVRDKDDAHEAHAEHKKSMKELESMSAAEFDRAYVKLAVKHHEKDVSEFEKASQKLTDTELRAFAAKTLPTLREHLQTAKSLQSQVGNTGAPDAATGTESGSNKSATQEKNSGTQDNSPK